MMRGVLIFSALAITVGGAFAETKGEDRAVAIGPWQIEASFTASDKFDRCVMSRTTEEGVETRIARDADGLTLSMASPRWKLEKGKKYDVEFAAGPTVWKSEVNAAAKSIQVALTDQKFNAALRTADQLEVRGAGSTMTLSLEKSAAALSRLDSCYETNVKAVETNPFVAPNP